MRIILKLFLYLWHNLKHILMKVRKSEFCRGCWMQYGFMFPKLDDETSRPVDGVYNYVRYIRYEMVI